jgi:hypothetical protein
MCPGRRGAELIAKELVANSTEALAARLQHTPPTTTRAAAADGRLARRRGDARSHAFDKAHAPSASRRDEVDALEGACAVLHPVCTERSQELSAPGEDAPACGRLALPD